MIRLLSILLSLMIVTVCSAGDCEKKIGKDLNSLRSTILCLEAEINKISLQVDRNNSRTNSEVDNIKSRVRRAESEVDSFADKLAEIYLDCRDTQWGQRTSCEEWPEAEPPKCPPGYAYVGLSRESHTDSDCGVSKKNKQKVKGRCCRIRYR